MLFIDISHPLWYNLYTVFGLLWEKCEAKMFINLPNGVLVTPNKRKEVMGLNTNPYYHEFSASLDSEVIIGTAILLATILIIVARITRIGSTKSRKNVIVRARKARTLCDMLDRDYTPSGRSLVMPSASADYSLALVFGGLEAFLLYRFCHAGLTQLMLNIFGEWVGYLMVLFADIVGIMVCVTAMWVYARLAQLAVVAVKLHYNDRHANKLKVSQRCGISDIVFSLTKRGRRYAATIAARKAQQKQERDRNERAERYYRYETLQAELAQHEVDKIDKIRGRRISMTTNKERMRRAK